MKRLLEQLWNEDDGFVLSTETVLYGTIGVVGVGAGYTALRDSVNSELSDLGRALGSIDQSYWFAPVCGHSAWTAGSAFFDTADYCDHQQVQVEAPCPDRPLVCADVFGRGDEVLVHEEHGLRQKIEDVPQGEVHRRGPAPHGPAVLPPPSKGVFIEPGPACVVGSPALVPAHVAAARGLPVNVMVNPHQPGPYMVTVPEGFFNMPPGTAVPAPHYRVLVHGQSGPRDFGYAYAPQHGVKSGASWDTIDLGFAKVGDDELKDIDDQFEKAKCLHVLGSNVTNKGLGYICEMDELESLHLVGTQITDAGMKQLLKLKKLRFLHLVGMQITDEGLIPLAGMQSLEELDIRGTPVSDEVVAALQKELPKLRVIR